MRLAFNCVLIAALQLAAASTGRAEGCPRAEESWFAQVEFHASLLSDVADRSLMGVTFGPAVKIGRRWDRWGAFVSLEHNAWMSSDFGDTIRAGALNIGLGGEVRWAKGFVRTSVTVGPSVLLFDTALDGVGSTGIYADVRPVGLRWAVTRWLVLMLDPLAFTVVAPVLSDPALVLVQYRSTFTTECRW